MYENTAFYQQLYQKHKIVLRRFHQQESFSQNLYLNKFYVQDYNWDEQGFSLISRFYDDIAQLLDDKFKTAYNMTYGTMGRYSAIDTSMYRRATWNYIQVL